MSGVVVCIGSLQEQDFEQLKSYIQENSKNVYFYWLSIEGTNSDDINWKQIVYVKNSKKVLASAMEFDPFGRIVLDMDMQGLHVNCSTLSWAPYFTPSH